MKKEQLEEFDDIAYRKGLTGEAAFQARTEKGMQPVIDIAGHPYYLSVRWNLLQPKMMMGEMIVRPDINLAKDCYWDDSSEKFLMFYDVKKRTPFEVSEDITTLPKNVVFIKIPNTYEADPVGMAREDRIANPGHYLEKFPIKMYHTAEVIELKNSPLMELINRNKQKRQKPRSARWLVDPAKKGKRKS